MASNTTRSTWRRLTGAGAMIVALAGCALTGSAEPGPPDPGPTSAAPTAAATTKAASGVEPGWPRWGFTHTGVSANNISPRFEEDVSGSLSRTPMLQNQHIMGFGALNPEPYPGEYHWEDLDSRLNLIKESGGTAVVTLCCAPDWMKGGPQGPTEDSAWKEHLEDAPYPKHFDDFAKLSAAVAKRYPDVKYFMVWNEFKGFWKNHAEPADFKGYTQLYNKVYDAVKAVRPDAKVGGPYIGFDSNKSGDTELSGDWGVVNQNVLDAFNYWFENKKGADFIVVDGASPTDAHELLPDEFGALAKFGAVTKWLRDKVGDLPVWWSEWYFVPEDGSTTWPEPKRLAVQAASMIELARGGAATALYWNPQAKQAPCVGCLWNARSGAQTPTGKMLSDFTKWFPAEARLDPVTSSDPKVWVLAQPEQMVLVNTTGGQVTTSVDGKDFTLKAYEVKWSGR
ncbi:xylan 1,4-beta-xylosidase [Nonomuraea sp. NPDC002799]